MSNTIIKHGTPEWFTARRGKITGSTAAAILAPGAAGVRGTPLTEFYRITQELAGNTPDQPDLPVDEDEQDDSLEAILRWGSKSEDFHAELLRGEGFDVRINRDLVSSTDRPWLCGTPDGYVETEDGSTSVLELKAPVHNFALWREEAPVSARIQASLYMHLTDKDSAIVSALIPPKPRWHTVLRNEQWESWALEQLDIFWHEHIQKDIPPDVTPTETDLEMMKLIYPTHVAGEAVRLTDAALAAAAQLEQAKAMKKQAEQIEAEAKAIIIAAIGDAEYGVLPDGSGFTYRASSRSEPAREARTVQFRTLRFSKNLKF